MSESLGPSIGPTMTRARAITLKRLLPLIATFPVCLGRWKRNTYDKMIYTPEELSVHYGDLFGPSTGIDKI